MGSVAKRRPSVDPATGALASDVDALVVTRPSRLPAFVMRQGALQEDLEARLGTSASVAPITPGILAKAPPSVWFCELKFGGRTIHGPDVLANIPIDHPSDVDPFQGVVVGLNYLHELERLPPAGAGSTAASTAKVARSALGAADAFAAASGRYDVAIERRARTFAAHGPSLGNGDSPARLVADALRLRLSPRRLPPEEDVAFRERVSRALHATVAFAARRGLDPGDSPSADGDALRLRARLELPRAYALQFGALHALRERSLLPLARCHPGAVALLWGALFDLTDATADGARRAAAERDVRRFLGLPRGGDPLARVLDAWRAITPAYGPVPAGRRGGRRRGAFPSGPLRSTGG